MQLMQNKKGYPTVSWQRRSFYPQWKAFSQAIYIQSIEPQTVLSAGYPPPQMKNHLIIGKAQRKGIYTKILSKAWLDITLKNKCTLWSKCLSWNLIFLLCFFFCLPLTVGDFLACNSDTCHSPLIKTINFSKVNAVPIPYFVYHLSVLLL